MRTTINLAPDVVPLVRDFAASRDLTLGQAVSHLVRRGLAVRNPRRLPNGSLVFDLPDDSPRISSAHVKRLESEPR
jgi:hypothetical protein